MNRSIARRDRHRGWSSLVLIGSCARSSPSIRPSRRWCCSSASRGARSASRACISRCRSSRTSSITTSGCSISSRRRGGRRPTTRSSWSSTPTPATRIVDPLMFYQSVRNEAGCAAASARSSTRSLRRVLGKVSMAQMLTARARRRSCADPRRGRRRRPRHSASRSIDVRMKRVDLPQENSQAIFRACRPSASRRRGAIRAEGQRDAQTMRAEADKQRVVILAEARASRRRSCAARATPRRPGSTPSLRPGPAFFDFYRSLQA